MRCERCLCEDLVEIHGHTQCTNCGSIVEECCRGEAPSTDCPDKLEPKQDYLSKESLKVIRKKMGLE